MKKILLLSVAVFSMLMSFSQIVPTKQNAEKIIKEIINDIKSDNIISFYNKQPSYNIVLNTYLENGYTEKYDKIKSDSLLFKANQGAYNKRLFTQFVRFKGYHWDLNLEKNIKLRWKEVDIKDVLTQDPITINNKTLQFSNQIKFTVLLLVTEKNSDSPYVIKTEAAFTSYGKFISAGISNVYADFHSIKDFLIYEDEDNHQTISMSSKSSKPQEVEEKPIIIEKIYANQNEIAFPIKFVYEQTERNTRLKGVYKMAGTNEKEWDRQLYSPDAYENVVFVFDEPLTSLYWVMYENEIGLHVFSFDDYFTPGSLKEFDIMELKK